MTSTRYYLADADFRVALESDDLNLLRSVAGALGAPRWPLFLGRKAFVPNFPVCRGVRRETSMFDALQQEPWFYRSLHERPEHGRPFSLRAVIEVASPDESDGVRIDTVDSFASREFRLRHVTTKWVEITTNLIQEDCHVPLPIDS